MKCKYYAEFEGVCCNGDCKPYVADSCPIDGDSDIFTCKYAEFEMTNADHIRSMTDEELTDVMQKNSIKCICEIVCGDQCTAIASFGKTSEQSCREILLDWLKQPYKENEKGCSLCNDVGMRNYAVSLGHRFCCQCGRKLIDNREDETE